MQNIIIILFMVFTVSAFAQQRETGRKDRATMVKMSPEERAEISSKKIALALNLSEAQRREIKNLHLEQANEKVAKRAEMRKTAKENKTKRIARMNKNFDKRLGHHEKMKEILTEEQYAKWKKSKKGSDKRNNFTKKKTI